MPEQCRSEFEVITRGISAIQEENERLRAWLQRIADLNKDGPGEAMARRALRGMTIEEAEAEDAAFFKVLDRFSIPIPADFRG